jgi:hypothetical protein
MRYFSLFLVVALSLFLQGCSGSHIQNVAQNTTVKYYGTVVPNAAAEALLEEDFGSSPVPWDPEMVAEIEKARNALAGMAEYLHDRLNFDTSLPYYTYKNGFEFTAHHYMKLQNQLDERKLVPGAVSEWGLVIYEYVKRDINAALDAQRRKIAATEASIEDEANEDAIQDMKNLYNTLSPLIKMVL